MSIEFRCNWYNATNGHRHNRENDENLYEIERNRNEL